MVQMGLFATGSSLVSLKRLMQSGSLEEVLTCFGVQSKVIIMWYWLKSMVSIILEATRTFCRPTCCPLFNRNPI